MNPETEKRLEEVRARLAGSDTGQQLVHSTREMFLSRIAKYDDPRNEEWDWADVDGKWTRHAYAAFRDLLAAEEDLRRFVEANKSFTQGNGLLRIGQQLNLQCQFHDRQFTSLWTLTQGGGASSPCLKAGASAPGTW